MYIYTNLFLHLKLRQKKNYGQDISNWRNIYVFFPELLHIKFIDICCLADHSGLAPLMVLEPKSTGRRTGEGDPNSDQLNAEN